MIDPVPWFVGGGAQHSPEIARLLAFAAFRGAEGVVGSGDCKVAPLATPGTSVRVLPGAASILNRSGTYESYAARVTSEEVLPVAATTSSGGRSDLIVLRVEDPYAPGTPWAAPATPASGPYVFARVIANVPAGTTRLQDVPGRTTDSGIALARIDLPASTSVVNAGNIVDLRTMPGKRSERVLKTVIGGTNNDLTTAYPAYQDWPAAASFSIPIPSWATKAYVRANIGAAALLTASVTGRLRVNLGGSVSADTGYDLNYTGSVSRSDFFVPAEFAIPASMRGTNQTIKLQGNRSGGTGNLRYDNVTISAFDVEFREDVV